MPYILTLIVVLSGAVIFAGLVTGIASLPLDSMLALGLNHFGHDLISASVPAGEVVQLPLTVPLYLVGGSTPFAVLQHDALASRPFWALTLFVWLTVLMLVRPRRVD